ncbi:Uncharacterized protein TCM_007327 [Theobroma cacao]|uniref:Uncharacterized protein n=1 Tax=Theobroma cacao TaxID=3641 RepID=A0A061E2Q9_THECC|nr:Uncharacterized protein TCM_007327 [Theobroma cacao]
MVLIEKKYICKDELMGSIVFHDQYQRLGSNQTETTFDIPSDLQHAGNETVVYISLQPAASWCNFFTPKVLLLHLVGDRINQLLLEAKDEENTI